MPKNILKTIRFTSKEARAIEDYLRHNPSLDSISSLGRVAIMEFIRTQTSLSLHPLCERPRHARPSFLWDYDLPEAQVHEILRHSPFDQHRWLIARILERARLEEVLHYLTIEQIRDALPHLRLPPAVTRHWQEAIALWTNQPSTS
jgi:hypothetical protein